MAFKLDKLRNFNLDVDAIKSQFQGLQGKHPGLWPSVPKFALLVAGVAAIVAVTFFAYWQGQIDELEAGRAKEEQLKTEFRDKVKQAVNLDALKQQKIQVEKFVGQLEKQLPSKAQMDALLTDINQAGVGRGLKFESFTPGAVVVKEYYAELPINIKLAGNYHDLGAFTSDISNLARIVTLNNMKLVSTDKGGLTLEATAKTFRYLDEAEITAQRDAEAKKRAAAGPAPAPAAGGAQK